MSERERDDERSRIGELFRTAARGTEQDAERVAARIPAVLAEAARRRAAARSLPSAVVPLGTRWMPAMGTAAAVLAAVALWLGPVAGGDDEATLGDAEVDRLLLVGAIDTSGSDDVVLRALTSGIESTGGDDE